MKFKPLTTLDELKAALAAVAAMDAADASGTLGGQYHAYQKLAVACIAYVRTLANTEPCSMTAQEKLIVVWRADAARFDKLATDIAESTPQTQALVAKAKSLKHCADQLEQANPSGAAVESRESMHRRAQKAEAKIKQLTFDLWLANELLRRRQIDTAHPHPALSAEEVEALVYAEARWHSRHGGCDNNAAWNVCNALRRLTSEAKPVEVAAAPCAKLPEPDSKCFYCDRRAPAGQRLHHAFLCADGGWQPEPLRAKPTAAVQADDAMVERMARWMCQQGHRGIDPDTMTGDASGKWRLWTEYSAKTRAALTAALAHKGNGE